MQAAEIGRLKGNVVKEPYMRSVLSHKPRYAE